MAIPRRTPDAPLLLLRGGQVLSPDDLGQQDVLIGGGKILAVGRNLSMPASDLLEEVDATGLLILPGFIDAHVHIIGGGGEGGPETRNRDILLSSITRAGVTTVIGMLGVDCLTRGVEALLAKARGLTVEGITAYILTGGYAVPTPTITGSVVRDLACVEQVLGVGEIAISDHRSSQPTTSELAKVAAEARMGGLLGKKCGVVVVHVGNGPRGLQPLQELLATTEIPATQLLPCHVNRNPRLFAESIEYARSGGTVDLTAGIAPAHGMPDSIKPSQAVMRLLEAGVDIDRITMTSDANGNMPLFNSAGDVVGVEVQQVTHLYDEIRDLVREEGLPVETALRLVTENVARFFRLDRKGAVKPGKDADLVLAEPDLTLRAVYGGGRLLVRDGRALVRGVYE